METVRHCAFQDEAAKQLLELALASWPSDENDEAEGGAQSSAMISWDEIDANCDALRDFLAGIAIGLKPEGDGEHSRSNWSNFDTKQTPESISDKSESPHPTYATRLGWW